ncbi:MAG TPA: hypothetical protein VJX28_10095 [Chthoniobacterales bacterium]|nr:hypothetical protein [Chthoniobacterales bacterium]
MPRNLKSRLRFGTLLVASLVVATVRWSASASDVIPSGFRSDRYQSVWERNPFTLVTPVVQQAQPKFFDKLILVSWLNDGGTDVVFVANTETNELQKVTKVPNEHHLRLVSIHRDADPEKEEFVLSDGNEQGVVKFRTNMGATAGQNRAGAPGAVGQNPGVQQPIQPGLPRSVPRFRNGQTPPGVRPATQGVPQPPVAQPPVPQLPQMDATTTMSPPRASEVRRKRITAPPVVEQPVGEQTPSQNGSTQPQTQ